MMNVAAETMNLTEKSSLQSRRLRILADEVYRTRFYQDKMLSRRLMPNDIRHIADIQKFPFTTTLELEVWLNRDLLDTMGEFGPQNISRQSEMIARSLVACDITSSSVLMILQKGMDSGNIPPLQQAAASLGVTMVYGEDEPLFQVKSILNYGVTAIFSSPILLLQLADFLRQQGFSTRDLPLKHLFCEVNHCPADIREELKVKYQIPVYTLYGRTEIMEWGIGGECHQQHGLHIQDDHFYPEVVHPRTGAVLNDQQPGELVLTTLTRECMPLIRYRTGTFAILAREGCSCGRTTARVTFIS